MFEKIARHTDLVNAMAHSAGINLGYEVAERRLCPSTLRAAVVACMGCEKVSECKQFLADWPGAPRAAPEYCLNKAMIERL